jgi:hypothetical protein
VDQTQWRYEVIQPLVLFADRTTQQRAQEPDLDCPQSKELPQRLQVSS